MNQVNIVLIIIACISYYEWIKAYDETYGKNKLWGMLISLYLLIMILTPMAINLGMGAGEWKMKILEVINLIKIFTFSIFVFCWNSYELNKDKMYPNRDYPKGRGQVLFSGFWYVISKTWTELISYLIVGSLSTYMMIRIFQFEITPNAINLFILLVFNVSGIFFTQNKCKKYLPNFFRKKGG